MYSTCPDCRGTVWHNGEPHVCYAPTGDAAEVIRLRAELEQTRLQNSELKAEIERRKKLWDESTVLYDKMAKHAADAHVEARDAKRLVGELQKEVEKLKGPCTCEHDPQYAGGACGICHAEALDALETIQKACEGATGAALLGIGSVVKRALSHCAIKRVDGGRKCGCPCHYAHPIRNECQDCGCHEKREWHNGGGTFDGYGAFKAKD